MQTSPTLLTASTLALSLGLAAVAQAQETVALSFELEPSPTSESQATDPAPSSALAALPPANIAPLPIPPEATRPPLGNTQSAPSPQGNYGGGDALALASSADSEVSSLPAPPTLRTTALTSASLGSATLAEPDLTPLHLPEPIDIAVNFDLDPQAPPEAVVLAAATEAALDLTPLFAGGAESLVARAVGSAEGTRTPDGQRTPAYFGHTDPGNAVWNLGSFSYQHGASSPVEADQKQLQRLRSQAEQLQEKAAAHDLELSEVALLNGIDLANQAPMAALDRWGYIERLAQAQQSGLPEEEAIVWARTRAFLDPDTQRWNAPGLGNTIGGISADQTRRVRAIARAIEANPVNAAIPLAPKPVPASPTRPEPIDSALNFTPPSFPTLVTDQVSPAQTDPILSTATRVLAQPQEQALNPQAPTASAGNNPIGAIPTTQVYLPAASTATNTDAIQKKIDPKPLEQPLESAPAAIEQP
ncbi:MAG: hypothetical protein O2890_04790 [Cyanobacteria bacterium]|nr:hypothetical protein [Cyanobacteriota bacterium]MDA0865725.1 hypothetical protein [Cyanobacteriota bacterium]